MHAAGHEISTKASMSGEQIPSMGSFTSQTLPDGKGEVEATNINDNISGTDKTMLAEAGCPSQAAGPAGPDHASPPNPHAAVIEITYPNTSSPAAGKDCYIGSQNQEIPFTSHPMSTPLPPPPSALSSPSPLSASVSQALTYGQELR